MAIEYEYKKSDLDDKVMVETATVVEEKFYSRKALEARKSGLEYDRQVAADALNTLLQKYDDKIAAVQAKLDQAISLGIELEVAEL